MRRERHCAGKSQIQLRALLAHRDIRGGALFVLPS
jgi:hypothetical protein